MKYGYFTLFIALSVLFMLKIGILNSQFLYFVLFTENINYFLIYLYFFLSSSHFSITKYREMSTLSHISVFLNINDYKRTNQNNFFVHFYRYLLAFTYISVNMNNFKFYVFFLKRKTKLFLSLNKYFCKMACKFL